jgi:hypothetical protein
MARAIRVLLARNRGGLDAAAGDEWTILENTVKEFAELDSDDDQSLGNVGRLMVDSTGLVALAFREIGE